jgi:molybdopterin-guanine dinucleotide biosynthesis protein B
MRRSWVSIGVVGDSGVGKTTLLERLVPALEARGLAVGAVKHASHGFVADRPGKDSYRLYEAGARAVALASIEQIATFRRVAPAAPGARRDPALAEALAQLPDDLDVVLVEGFAWEPIPRIVLVQGREAPRKELLARGSLISIVRVTERLDDGRPLYRGALVARLVDEVMRRVRRHGWIAEDDPATGASAIA